MSRKINLSLTTPPDPQKEADDAGVRGQETKAAPACSVGDLFERHNDQLVSYLQTMLRSRDEAYEVAQEAYVRLLRLNSPGTVSFPRALLFRSARNLAIDRLRRHARTNQLLEEHTAGVETACQETPEAVFRARELAERLVEVVGELSPKCRRAFVLHRFRDMTFRDIAIEMELSESSVRKYVKQAMMHCHLRLQERE